jgi:hypothetical protein
MEYVFVKATGTVLLALPENAQMTVTETESVIEKLLNVNASQVSKVSSARKRYAQSLV